MLEGDATSTVGIQIDIKSEMMVKKRAGVNGGVKLEGFKPKSSLLNCNSQNGKKCKTTPTFY